MTGIEKGMEIESLGESWDWVLGRLDYSHSTSESKWESLQPMVAMGVTHSHSKPQLPSTKHPLSNFIAPQIQLTYTQRPPQKIDKEK